MKSFQQNLILLCFFALLIIDKAIAQYPDLQCYSCQSFPTDLTCLNDPTLVTGQNIVACPDGWCTIRRQEAIETPGEILSFLRGCEKTEPMFLDEIVVDAHQVNFFRSCRRNLCNVGDGVDSFGGPGGSGPEGTGPHIVNLDCDYLPEEKDSSVVVPEYCLSAATSSVTPTIFFLLLPLSLYNIL